ncbi:hypothetical protein ApAK_04035 [Thermoplasmatales archaeon AK]|nr:hypothetical protein [Thermoplasmatales archaeon AK]
MARKLLKVLISVIIVLAVIVYSGISLETSPKSMQIASYDKVRQELTNAINLNFGNLTLYYAGQSATFYLGLGTLVGNWTSSSDFLMLLHVSKISQKTGFTVTGISMEVDHIQVLANGTPLVLSNQGSQIYNGSVYEYIMDAAPQGNYFGEVNVSFSFDAYLILQSWIYHISVFEGRFTYNQTLKLLPS